MNVSLPSRAELLIIYHSMTGGTHQMAQACAQGARADPSVSVVLKHASQTDTDDILRADGYVFATPEYLGSMSGLMKDCFDRTYYPCLERLQGKPYAVMVCAGSDGQGAVKQIERIVTGWRLKAVAPPIIINVRAQTPERILATKQLTESELDPCVELGAMLGAGLGMGMF
ncbi:NAD(P)H-dependent oxidoreductase [Orrella daihaiensis]|uniref:NAD(P)H-dependent oxidoreductase n=1 Tax=Orrella daihaiensis TaxID=2782176 RepID=A0ABY4ALA8_9BURK|nr:NAD(P)H-dependent oxidoreductase [Orrella daihaiensis]